MNNNRLSLAAACMLLAAMASQAHAAEVVRIAEVPREGYEQLHEMADFWGLDPKTGDVIMYATERQRTSIESLGYEVRRDEQRMRSLEYARSIDVEAWERSGAGGIPGFACYRTVDETKTDLSAMATERPDLARWESIGESWLEANGEDGGDDLYVLVLGNQNSPHEQPPFVLMAAQHARELTTAETATRFAEWLFDNYDTDPTARWLLDHREIHIVAQQNPDGRREVEDGESMWRKNSNLDACPVGGWTGIDLNRNNQYFFNGPSTSGDPCDQVYPGTDGASEPETQAIQAYLDQVFDRHRPGDPNDLPTDPVPDDADGLFISLHSFGNLVLFPWEGKGAGASNHSPNHEQLAWLGRRFGFFTGYEIGRAILYAAGGTTPDYAYGEFGVAAYTYEIGSEFQEQCNAFENNLWPDLLESLIYAAKAAARPYQAPSGPDILSPAASYDQESATLDVSGTADDTRFDRGGVSEGPATDPIENISEIRASFGQPPNQAPSWFSIQPDESNPTSNFASSIDLSGEDTVQRQLFIQSHDESGHIGVPESVWISGLTNVVPHAINDSMVAGQSIQKWVTIENLSDEVLDWTIAAESLDSLRGEYDPTLNETLDLADFTLTDDGEHSQSLPAGVDDNGMVVGFTFEGSVAGVSGNQTYASDMVMNISSPDSTGFSVGGFNTGNEPWQFQGSGSTSDGTYSSTHIGSQVFGDNGVPDEGEWQFDFEHTYEDTMDWSDVSVTLHKNPPPHCLAPSGIAWLEFDQDNGSVQPGDAAEIAVNINGTNLSPGTYAARLCITTNDPTSALTTLNVEVEVFSPELFEDRFEPTLR